MTELASLTAPSKSLFWTASVSDGGEMSTDDPLGLEYIAQQVGLMLLPTFTTRSSRAQAYAMVLYGLRLAERAVGHFDLPNTDEMRRSLFERWERFWALATLESVGGKLPRGDWNTMRGVRGAKAAWFEGNAPLPLDFSLISRQQELGNLGAYLAPLRRAGLVHAGGLAPSLHAAEVVDGFWGEPSSRTGTYEDLALYVLDPKVSKVERADLKKAGKRSRLTAIWERPEQAARLYSLLFSNAKDDTTYPTSELVRLASEAGIETSRDVIEAALGARLGVLSDRLRSLLSTALRYGDFMAQLLASFDRAYVALTSAGFAMDHGPLSAATFEGESLPILARAAAELLAAPCVNEIGDLPAHGRACLRLASDLQSASPSSALELVLTYHHKVQRERSRGTGWISHQEGKHMLLVTTYTPRANHLRFPSYKLDVVRTLLTDLGKIARAETLPAEAAS